MCMPRRPTTRGTATGPLSSTTRPPGMVRLGGGEGAELSVGSLGQNPEDVIEFVTYPNNPTGEWRHPVYPSGHVVHDMVYYWPSLVDVEVQDWPVMLFSMSKLSGHADADDHSLT